MKQYIVATLLLLGAGGSNASGLVMSPAAIANQCGRSETVLLAAIAATHRMLPYPPISRRLGEEGMSRLKVLVGQDGAPTDIRIEQSSGWERLDAAAIESVKQWRWTPPPSECAAMGVQLPIVFDWHLNMKTLNFGFDDENYPAAARAQKISGAGIVTVTQRDGAVTDVRMDASTGSPELDAAMMQFAHDHPNLSPSLISSEPVPLSAQIRFRFGDALSKPSVLPSGSQPATP